ncbi:hypothetical protein [Sphingobacterium sp.]|uniref:hypothetical protein n=1 Tax=Sphingobacterium sp. TaxID=341027 RepID=UPI0028AE1A71|nr:hypothetical protein [Sphingobacterium sp.]
MDNHSNPSLYLDATKNKQILIASIRQTVETGLNKTFSQLRIENSEDYLYYLGLWFVTTTNKAICQALNIPVEAGTRYKRTLEKAGLLVHSNEKYICPYTLHKSHLLSTNPKEFTKLLKSTSKQLNLFEIG